MALYESQDTASVSPSFVALAVQQKAERAAKSRMSRILEKAYVPWTVLKMRHAVSPWQLSTYSKIDSLCQL
jgi:hypothetical protein